MKSLMKLEDVMHADYEKMTTNGTETILMAIGVVSTFFKLEPNVIKELHKSCNLNSIVFLQKIYTILTGNDFHQEEYKSFYDCNERIILSAIAFLTLPETVEALHRRLPAVIVPRLPSKPKPPVNPTRQKSSCPYKEELFRCVDWIGYRTDLQKWRKLYKSLAIPKVILPFRQYEHLPINTKVLSEVKSFDERDPATKFERKDIMNIDQQETENHSSKINSDTQESATFDISRLPDASRKFGFNIKDLDEISSGVVQYKNCGIIPPRAKQKSWLGEKDVHYMIAGATENLSICPVTYEITGVANITPTNSNERFFAVLRHCDKRKRIFPKGRENLSRNWQEWLQRTEEEFRPMETKANKLIKNMEATMKSVFPEPTCDSCCPCRQTKKTRKRLQETKMPYLLIDNVIKDGDGNIYIVGSTAMHSPAPSLTESTINLPEVIASEDKIKTNVIINNITNQDGETQYHILGVQKDKIHIPSRVIETVVPQPVKNIPSCACAIQQMFNENVSPSSSKDDIPWTKDEGLCFGKKYRPDEPAAYSCRMYPGDKSCRRNPFMKDMAKIKRKKKEKEESAIANSGKNKEIYSMANFQSYENEHEMNVQGITCDGLNTFHFEELAERKSSRKKILKADNPGYNNLENISRTVPLIKNSGMNEEKTSSISPAISSSLRNREMHRNVSSSNKKLKRSRKNTTDKRIDEEASRKIFLGASKGIRKEETKEKGRIIDIKKRNNPQKSTNKITIDERRDMNPPSNTFRSVAINKAKMQPIKLSSPNKSNKWYQSNRVKNIYKNDLVKKNRRKNITYEVDKIDGRNLELSRLKNMLKSSTIASDNMQSMILPEEPPTCRQLKPDEKSEDVSVSSAHTQTSPKEGPYGRRTKSEQELPAKKTIAYLCEPDYPLETVAMHPGGQRCHCRENRNKKKILMYNVGGLVDKQVNGKRGRKKFVGKGGENRIIDGVVYCTPPVSPRRSDEYVPEYEFRESPYDMCIGEVTDKRLKLIEKYSGPKSLVEKIRKKPKSCCCSSYMNASGTVSKNDELVDEKRDITEAQQKLIESKSPEERWMIASKDVELMNYFAREKDDIPCWISCAKFDKTPRARTLKMMKPVCECKYERKILERNEDKTKWKARQRRLKSLKKQSYMHVIDTSRPMVSDNKLVISGVKRISQGNVNTDDIKYCITDVAENVSMAPPVQIIDGFKMSTPFETPEPSKEEIPQIALHHHWSPTNIPPGPLPRKDAALKEEMKRRMKIRDEAFNFIYGNNIGRNTTKLGYQGCQKPCDQEKLINGMHETKRINTNMEKKIPELLIHSLSKKISSKVDHQQDMSYKEIVSKANEKKKAFKEVVSSISSRQNTSYKPITEKTKEKNDESHLINGDDNARHPAIKLNLSAIIKTELMKMAAEGYIFAKLPECHRMPQLRCWIMYRQGVFSEIDRRKLMQTTFDIWRCMEVTRAPKIKVPLLDMTKYQLAKLTFDRVGEMKEMIAANRAIFHSEIRKARVVYARSMWQTMEFGKFPSASFKKAYFTYMAGKEADGHVFKPWVRSEFRKQCPKSSCYQ